MYAIIRTGGKQYRVAVGDTVKVETLEAEAGSEVTLNDVLLVAAEDGSIKAGKPVVEGVCAKAEVMEQTKGDKVVVFKYKAKKNIRKKQGHRQPYTKVKINTIG